MMLWNNFVSNNNGITVIDDYKNINRIVRLRHILIPNTIERGHVHCIIKRKKKKMSLLENRKDVAHVHRASNVNYP